MARTASVLVEIGAMSKPLAAKSILFRETGADYDLGFHTAPRRQFVITISGLAELECGDGSRRRFGAGDVLLVDDTTGQGHITREIQGPRHIIFIPLPQELDVSAWRVHTSG